MSALADTLRTMTGDSGSLMLFVLVFVTVFAAVAFVGLHLMQPAKSIGVSRTQRESEFRNAQFGQGAVDAAPPRHLVAGTAAAEDRSQSARKSKPSLRSVLATIHSALSILILGTLATITVAAYFIASPHDGSFLVPIVLLVATALMAMHLQKSADRFKESESDLGLGPDVQRTLQSEIAAKIGAALLQQGKVQWEIASPEVHSIDAETLERARSLAAEGVPFDEICRGIQPDYAAWSEPHRLAYQSVIRAAIGHGDNSSA